MKNVKALVAGASVAIALAAASGAGATTIIKNLGPISGTSPGVSLPYLTLKKGNIYDFTFSLVAPIADPSTTSTQIQAQAQNGGGAVPIGFTLFGGTPSAPGTSYGTTALGLQAMLSASLGLGDYFIQIKGNEIAVTGEAPSGTVLTSSVPEPATWGVMLVGFGAIGSSMRSARRKRAAAATA